MAFKRIQTMDLYQLISRQHSGYSISAMSEAPGLDRKTVRQYIRLAEQAGLEEGRAPAREGACSGTIRGLGFTPALTTTCRFETEPGEELQIDYGKMGRIYDPLSVRIRVFIKPPIKIP